MFVFINVCRDAKYMDSLMILVVFDILPKYQHFLLMVSICRTCYIYIVQPKPKHVSNVIYYPRYKVIKSCEKKHGLSFTCNNFSSG